MSGDIGVLQDEGEAAAWAERAWGRDEMTEGQFARSSPALMALPRTAAWFGAPTKRLRGRELLAVPITERGGVGV